MALQGSLRDFSATEILQLVGSQKKTGCLTMEWNTERIVVFVQDGRIVSTRMPGLTKDDPLLAFLLKVHRLSPEQHQGILTIQRDSSRDLEDLLINGRYLDAEELTGFLERQILDDLTRLGRWENGTYRFDPHTRWTATPLVRLSIEGALIEAARRVDEQKRFHSVFKDPYQLLGVRDLPDPDAELAEEEREMFGIIDGLHTVSEVVDAAPLSEYEAYEALYRMLDANWIEFVGRRDPGSVPAAAPASSMPVSQRARPYARELALAGMVVAALMVLRLLSIAIDPGRRPPPPDDVFAAARMRDLRFALDLYRRENGVYPEKLEALVEERWISPRQGRVDSYLLLYTPGPDRASYRLDLQPTR
jgi:hypothetical protein